MSYELLIWNMYKQQLLSCILLSMLHFKIEAMVLKSSLRNSEEA